MIQITQTPDRRWRIILEEFFSSMDRLPVAVRLNTCIDCGRSIYGFEVRYADRFLTAPIGDLPKLIEALQKLLKLADSYNYTTNMNLPPE